MDSRRFDEFYKSHSALVNSYFEYKTAYKKLHDDTLAKKLNEDKVYKDYATEESELNKERFVRLAKTKELEKRQVLLELKCEKKLKDDNVEAYQRFREGRRNSVLSERFLISSGLGRKQWQPHLMKSNQTAKSNRYLLNSLNSDSGDEHKKREVERRQKVFDDYVNARDTLMHAVDDFNLYEKYIEMRNKLGVVLPIIKKYEKNELDKLQRFFQEEAERINNQLTEASTKVIDSKLTTVNENMANVVENIKIDAFVDPAVMTLNVSVLNKELEIARQFISKDFVVEGEPEYKSAFRKIFLPLTTLTESERSSADYDKIYDDICRRFKSWEIEFKNLKETENKFPSYQMILAIIKGNKKIMGESKIKNEEEINQKKIYTSLDSRQKCMVMESCFYDCFCSSANNVFGSLEGARHRVESERLRAEEERRRVESELEEAHRRLELAREEERRRVTIETTLGNNALMNIIKEKKKENEFFNAARDPEFIENLIEYVNTFIPNPKVARTKLVALLNTCGVTLNDDQLKSIENEVNKRNWFMSYFPEAHVFSKHLSHDAINNIKCNKWRSTLEKEMESLRNLLNHFPSGVKESAEHLNNFGKQLKNLNIDLSKEKIKSCYEEMRANHLSHERHGFGSRK